MAAIYVAVVHGPVRNRNGEAITTAITGLNLHDIGRAATTYGAAGFFVVTPLEAQQAMIARMLDHWRRDTGAGSGETRSRALASLQVVDSLADVMMVIARKTGDAPESAVTSAQPVDGVSPISYGDMRARAARPGPPVVLVFGTGWGLAAEVMANADWVLPPLRGAGEYNHLSVRSAAVIVLDRILAQ